jgi:hypothetical protein
MARRSRRERKDCRARDFKEIGLFLKQLELCDSEISTEMNEAGTSAIVLVGYRRLVITKRAARWKVSGLASYPPKTFRLIEEAIEHVKKAVTLAHG